ncbi:hypothetical protein VLG1_17250 [Lactobacillus paragasseri]
MIQKTLEIMLFMIKILIRFHGMEIKKKAVSETLTAFFKISVDDSILVILSDNCNFCWQSFNYLIEN